MKINILEKINFRQHKENPAVLFGGVVVLALAGLAVVYFIFARTDVLTPESLQQQLPSISLDEKVSKTGDFVKKFETDRTPCPFDEKILNFSCDSDPTMPGCGATLNVKNWDEYASVVREEIFPMVRELGYDPCRLILSLAMKDKSLYAYYDPGKDPLIVDCK